MHKTRSAVLLAGLFLLGVATATLPIRADGPAPKKKAAAPDNPKLAADALGYSAAFEAHVKKIGQITPDDFARRYPGKANYLDKLTWDPTTAKFFDRLMLDPNKEDAKVGVRGPQARFYELMQREKGIKGPPTRPAKGMYDFRLNADEQAAFKKNGFVVSERMGAASCTDMLYRIYERDLPVFLSADAILHAWHRTYDAMLEEIEVTFLAPTLAELLDGMSARLSDARRKYGAGVLADSVTDADYFLTVARSLLAGKAVKGPLGQDERVAHTLTACDRLELEEFDLFGRHRKVDFSQFKPRGHYEKSDLLKRYFKAMMWCGRIDLRVAGGKEETRSASSPREMGAAIVLHDLLRGADKFEQWRQFDRMIETFVGRTDSMTFAQLDGILAEARLKSPADVKDLDTLAALQKKILAGKIGQQEIRSDHFINSADHPIKIELPRSFTLLGQRFVMDSWVTAKLVFDDIIWNDRKVIRRIPSCLDVAFAALGNDQVVPELVARMKDRKGREFRDGLDYQHNLAATREVIDAHTENAWKENLYTNWLACLRELSVPTTDRKYPEAMRTQAWAMRTLNTQMASWTQLRHDTVLYAKQSYTAEVSCFYPAGYVEPVPHFWGRLEEMAGRAADMIDKTPYPDREIKGWDGKPVVLKGKETKARQSGFLRNFAKSMATLKGIAEKELAQKELSKEEVQFIENTVQLAIGCGGPRRYTGWYPGLFYEGSRESDKWDALVADVHTNVPSPVVNDPGCVLHQGVGNIDLLVIAIDNGKDRMVYVGPTLSHYEFEMPGVTRKSDSEWRKDINTNKLPPRPS
ncbi:MAG TPA: DUF3160 domain-containing protein, partial [Gemmataceae bacterium]|nr:DUF3160 domain-containing protein [Gemmataceae bacterium]